MSKLFKDFCEFKLNEETVEGYEYHFTFDGDEYTIKQGTKDKTIFGIRKKDSKDWLVMTKGKFFDAQANGMDLKEMTDFLQRGIKFFNIRGEVDVEIVKDSEWAKFFDFELKKKPGRINKKYAVLKLHVGKAACKWLARQ